MTTRRNWILASAAWLTAAALTVGGCKSDGFDSARHDHVPDGADIAEAPAPDIQFETFVAAGDLAASRGQFGRAAEQYEHGLKARPNDAPILRKVALAYAKMGQTTATIDAWKRYLVATHESADAYGTLGYAYELAGNPTEAEKTYLAGIKQHPDGALVHINYGLMLVRKNKIDEAVKQMSAVLQPHEVNYNIAGVYDQMGRRDLAQFYYRRALECNPEFSPARQKLSMAN